MNTIVALQRLFRDVFDDDNLAVAPETSRDDVEGWDSVAQVKLVLAAEEAFGIQFHDDEASSMRTVGDFLRSIQLRRSRAA